MFKIVIFFIVRSLETYEYYANLLMIVDLVNDLNAFNFYQNLIILIYISDH